MFIAPTPISDQQLHNERLRGMCDVYQGADRILSGERLTVAVESHGMMPIAWTDGVQIIINGDRITSVDADSTERMHGVNFHELAHVLFTPRKGTQLVSWVLDYNYMQAFNILEDQRIETLLTAQYPSTKPWLTAAIARWVLEGDSRDTGYLFVRGRRYLPGSLRGALRATFVRPDLLDEVCEIVDKYRTLVFPADYEIAKELIVRFHAVLKALQPDTPTGGSGGGGDVWVIIDDPFGHDERPVDAIDKGRPKGQNDQKDAAKNSDEGEEEQVPENLKPRDLPQDSEDSEDPEDPDKSDAESGDDPDDVESEGESTGSESTRPQDRGESDGGSLDDIDDWFDDVDLDDLDEREPTTFVGGRKAGSQDGSKDILEEVAREVLREIRSRDEIKKDINRTLRQISGADASDLIDKARWQDRPPRPEYAVIRQSLVNRLQRMVRQAEPGWHTHAPSGRVSPLRWEQDHDITTAFDVWDEGVHDAFDVEVVIGLDESGSMGGVFESAANAMWALKAAFDTVGLSTTVFTFNGSSQTLYHRSEKAALDNLRWSFRGGGTDPSDGLKQAAHIFARTPMTQKILIMLTDGSWWGRSDEDGLTCDDYIARMNRAGVITALGFIQDDEVIDPDVDEDYTHGVHMARSLRVDDLVPFISSIVSSSIKARLIRH